MQTFLLEAPYSKECLNIDKKKVCNWLTNNYHHLEWNSGTLKYDELSGRIHQIIKQNTVIYTRGLEKSRTLSILLGQCVQDCSSKSCCTLTSTPSEQIFTAIINNNHQYHGVHCSEINELLLQNCLNEHNAIERVS